MSNGGRSLDSLLGFNVDHAESEVPTIIVNYVNDSFGKNNLHGRDFNFHSYDSLFSRPMCGYHCFAAICCLHLKGTNDVPLHRPQSNLHVTVSKLLDMTHLDSQTISQGSTARYCSSDELPHNLFFSTLRKANVFCLDDV
jgi:hypothetical protein